MTSPLELLPLPLFHKIVEYILIVDYETEKERKLRDPFILKVRLQQRGYALAVCSRTCHAHMESAVKLFLAECPPFKYFLQPPPEILANNLSNLALFYIVKAAECQFRSEFRVLLDLPHPYRDVEKEKELVQQTQKILVGPIVKNNNYASRVLDNCMVACQRALRFRQIVRYTTIIFQTTRTEMARAGRNRFAIIVPDRGVAQICKPLVQAVLDHWQTISKSEDQYRRAQLGMLEAMYVQHALNMSDQSPDWDADELLLRRALFELALTDLQLILGWVQCIRLHMIFCLVWRYKNTDRVDASFELLERTRNEATMGSKEGDWWDPISIYFLTRCVAQNSKVYGLQRSMSFILESKRLLEDEIHKPGVCIHWRTYAKQAGRSSNEQVLSRYSRDVSSCLTALRQGRAFDEAPRVY